ncbi:MAG: ABC transporter ATP-binding protein [Deltaproteobacteria bacterium]|nr:ABC transporter ATP-binding protein [Deltaproteobacteria bacterium]
MLSVNNIEIVYNDVIKVVRGVSFEVPDQTIVALLGSNGAGKSTVLKAISGILELEDGELSEGEIEFDGRGIGAMAPEQIVAKGIVQIPEGRGIFDDLTVSENLRVGAHTRSDGPQVKIDTEKVLDYFPVLQSRLAQMAGYLSGGEQQMLAIGRALMTRCRLLMSDEPSLGLAPQIGSEIFRILQRITVESGASILLVEQNAHMALNIATYGYIMENGKIVLDGPSEKLIRNEDVKEFYLGLTEVGAKKSYRHVKHYKKRKRWLS